MRESTSARLSAVTLLRGVDQDDLDACIGGDIGDARAHHARTDHAQFPDGLIRDGGPVRALFQRFLVDEERPDHRGRGGVHQDRGEVPRLDPKRGVEGHERAFVDGGQQRLGRRVDAHGLAKDHGGGTDKGLKARRVVGRAAGHLVALLVPGLDEIGVGGREHPFARAVQQVFRRDDLVDQAGGLGLFGRDELAFQKEGGRRHRAQLADEAGGAARAGEDADHDLREADLGLRVVGGDDAVAGKRQFQPDAERGAGQGRDDGLGPFQGLRVHARAFDLAQHLVHLHHAVEDRLRAAGAHPGDDVQVHAAGKVLLAGGEHDPLDGRVGEGLVDEGGEEGEGLGRHHVHGFLRHVPGDRGDALGIGGQGEVGHGEVSYGLRDGSPVRMTGHRLDAVVFLMAEDFQTPSTRSRMISDRNGAAASSSPRRIRVR
jgi:hypothetical protein